MKNIGAAIAGGNGNRVADDFYPTPAEATVALIAEYPQIVERPVWEPAAGNGAMSSVFEIYGTKVFKSDIVDRGCGATIQDFLKTDAPPFKGGAIVTNPPFKLAEQFIAHSLSMEADFVALLTKATFWNAARRLSLFNKYQARMVAFHPLTWRLDFDGRGAPTMDCAWNVFASCTAAPTVFKPLVKPAADVDPFG